MQSSDRIAIVRIWRGREDQRETHLAGHEVVQVFVKHFDSKGSIGEEGGEGRVVMEGTSCKR